MHGIRAVTGARDVLLHDDSRAVQTGNLIEKHPDGDRIRESSTEAVESEREHEL